MVVCFKCTKLSVEELRNVDYKDPYRHHANVGELRACAETSSCDICTLLWRTMDDLTQLDASKSAIRDHPDETYGLYGQFYEEFEYKFGEPAEVGGLASFESTIKIEASFLNYNLGLSRTGIRLFAVEGTPAAQHFSERCTYFDPSPDLSIQLGKKWLGICSQHHEKCRPLSSVMPTRVIELGIPGTTPPRLLITAGLCEAYVALSYCWGHGATESLMLRDGSLVSMRQGIDETRLAQTYCEAFQLARELGFKYIWVDALCIIQGNKEDWEYESSKMGEVYGNAALCIVAARSSDAAKGFLRNDFKPVIDPCPFPYGRVDENGDVAEPGAWALGSHVLLHNQVEHPAIRAVLSFTSRIIKLI